MLQDNNSISLITLVIFTGLKFLVRICSDLGLKEAQEYATKLKKAEKAKELKEQVSLRKFIFNG